MLTEITAFTRFIDTVAKFTLPFGIFGAAVYFLIPQEFYLEHNLMGVKNVIRVASMGLMLLSGSFGSANVLRSIFQLVRRSYYRNQEEKKLKEKISKLSHEQLSLLNDFAIQKTNVIELHQYCPDVVYLEEVGLISLLSQATDSKYSAFFTLSENIQFLIPKYIK